ncbi:Rhodanese-like domain protein [Labilithrix luteola]|uniref:Rhodanese-like domain protein n=2 Tax=Labilithrix luteola TaxID=1391654 RepID=A0A0K1QCC1_9BACT|nr:Rhodanese-like domain protein [Labilithrix luteola]
MFFALAALSIVATGCDDPAKGKAKATTTEAVGSAAAPVTAASATTADYKFDNNGSKITWTGSKVTGKHDGGFGDFKGTVHLVDGAPEKSSVKVEIDAASINSDQEKLTGHLKSPDFFDVAKFTKVDFTSTEVKKGGEKGATHTITGNLSLHGVTKAITFPATIKVEGDQVSVESEFAVNRKDFGINYPGKQDDLIRDDVLVKLSVHAKK